MRIVLAAVLALMLGASALAAKPPEPSLTADEKAEIAKGKLVTRPDSDGSIPGVIGLIEIEADSEAIWSVILDVDLIRESNGSVTTCEKYRDETEGGVRTIGLHYVLSILWSEVRYHLLRKFHAAEDYMTWTLDPSKESDLEATEGSYSLWPGSGPGKLLLRYSTRTDTGRNLPGWVQSYLTTKTLKGYLDFVKETAESR